MDLISKKNLEQQQNAGDYSNQIIASRDVNINISQIQNCYLERHSSYVQMLSNEDEIVRLNAIDSLYHLAKEADICVERICSNFCDILCSDSKNSKKKHTRKEKQRVVKYLFDKDCHIFEHFKKRINNCHLVDLCFIESNIVNASFNNTIIENCKIHASEIAHSYFIGAEFRNVLFRTTQIKHSNFRRSLMSKGTNFSRSKIDDVIFSEINCNETIFNSGYINECDFSMATIRQSMFSNIKFVKCILEFNTINQTKMFFSKTEYMNDFRKMLPVKYENMIHVQENILSLP